MAAACQKSIRLDFNERRQFWGLQGFKCDCTVRSKWAGQLLEDRAPVIDRRELARRAEQTNGGRGAL